MGELKELLTFYHLYILPKHPAAKALQIPEQYEETFNALAALIDLPDDGYLIQESKVIVLNLIKAWEIETSNKFSFYKEIEDIYQLCTDSGGVNTLHGHKKSNPIFTYLMHIMMPSMQKCEQQFQILSPNFTKRINQCFEQMENANDNYRYSLCLAARKLTVSAPTITSKPSFDWSYEYKLGMAKAAIASEVQGEKLTTHPEWTYISDLLFRDRRRPGESSGGGSGKKKPRWLLFEQDPEVQLSQELIFSHDTTEEISDEDGFHPVEGGCVIHPIYIHPDIMIKELAEVGEFAFDYQINPEYLLPAAWFSDPWKARRKMRGKQEAMLASSRVAPWESSVLSLNNIQRLLPHINTSERSLHCAIMALALLLGISEAGLKKIRIGSFSSAFEPDEKETEKLLGGDRYYDPVNRTLCFLNPMGMEESSEYLNVPLLLQIPLPRCVTWHLPVRLEQGKTIFQPKDFSKAKKELKTFGSDGFRIITLGRLNATFDAYFVHGAGLPELTSEFIRGVNRPHLISQHYYISVDWIHAIGEWRHMVARILRFRKKDVSYLLQSMAYRNISEDNIVHKQYAGAVKTPSIETLKKHIVSLLNLFPRNKSELFSVGADGWNAYMAYVYFFIAVCTGRRPQRDPFPNCDDFDWKNESLYIDDKWNQRFREARIVPLCDSLLEILPECFDLIQQHFACWKSRGYESDCPIGLAFLVDEENRELVAVTPTNIDRLCMQTDGFLKGMKNGARHFLLTRLYQAGVHQEIIDFLSGHRHASREPEMSASPVSWVCIAEYLREVIEMEIVECLGLEAPFNE